MGAHITKVKISLIQMSMSSSFEDNLLAASEKIAESAKLGANIVCLPELFTSPYFPQMEKASAATFAEKIPGKTHAMLSKAAKQNKVVVVGGSIFENDGKLFNTTMVFDENGVLLGKYRKMHIPHDQNFYEQNYFEKGNLGFQVFSTKYGKIAPLICYDQWFPEAARSVSLAGADIIFYPTAIGTVEGVRQAEGNWQNAWETVQRGHAIANGIVVCSVNRVGKEEKMKFWGGSFICSQFGTILAKGSDKPSIIIAEIDLDLGKNVKEGWRFFYNRRPDAYGRLITE